MKYSNEDLLDQFTENGIIESIKSIDIDKIEDETIKIIARTIQYSADTVIRELNTRIKNRTKN